MTEKSKSGLAYLLVGIPYERGEYVTFYGDLDIKVNKFGMKWPVGNLSDEKVEGFVRDSQWGSLRMLVANYITTEGKEILEKTFPEGYRTSGIRDPFEMAINDGYIQVGQVAYYLD